MEIIGIGIDITECERIGRMLSNHGDHFLDHVFTDREREYCNVRKRSEEHFTGRWAAKEAVLKALGTGWITGITWRDVEIINEPGGRPIIRLSGGAKAIAEEKGIDEILISISHCRSHAVANATAIGHEKTST